jgi:hypothetical protein
MWWAAAILWFLIVVCIPCAVLFAVIVITVEDAINDKEEK